jgi:hypothetical protein
MHEIFIDNTFGSVVEENYLLDDADLISLQYFLLISVSSIYLL